MLLKKSLKWILMGFMLLALTACTPAPPQNPHSICSVFEEYPSWYWAAQDAQKKYGVPIHVQMAIVYQESRFKGKAKPPRTKILWVIPWKRPTSAYGYAQALNGTWDHYKKQSGNTTASRNNFSDATHFISWYVDQTHRKLGISKYNAYAQYLAFHEGMGGYSRGTYRKKAWLIKVARKVQYRADIFNRQLRACQGQLKKKPWWRFWT